MKNLFDIAMDIRYDRFLLKGLQDISNSTIFPVIPITMQQKVEKIMQEVSSRHTHVVGSWGSDTILLDEFIGYLDKTNRDQPTDSDHEFILTTAKLIRDYVKTSVRHVREALKDVDLSEEFPAPQMVPVPKKRKKSNGV